MPIYGPWIFRNVRTDIRLIMYRVSWWSSQSYDYTRRTAIVRTFYLRSNHEVLQFQVDKTPAINFDHCRIAPGVLETRSRFDLHKIFTWRASYRETYVTGRSPYHWTFLSEERRFLADSRCAISKEARSADMMQSCACNFIIRLKFSPNMTRYSYGLSYLG